MTRNNLLLEFTSSNGSLLDRLETICKNNELFLAEWQRDGNKIRILSEMREINPMICKEFSQEELDKLTFVVIPFEENPTQ
jgi:hypothetical protein